MQQRVKSILFRFFLIILLFPFLQMCLGMFSGLGLYGDFTFSPDVPFSWAKWWDGSYQQGKASYLNDQGGFRADLVRINNQVDYWLFDLLHCNSVVMGKNGCLFQPDYINAYYGRDYVGYDKARATFGKIKAIQDTLARLGKTLIVVHSPCKAYYYPSLFPDELAGKQVAPSNFETYVRLADSMKVNQVNFNTWFTDMRKSTTELLYPYQGIHWSVYGADLAADSLSRYIEQIRHIQMPHMEWNSLKHTEKAEDTDDDVYKALNLINPIIKETFTYPAVEFKEDATKTRPKVIYIGDSFIVNWIHNNYLQFSNTDWELWFYFHKVINQNNRAQPDNWIPMDNYDWLNKVKNSDVIVLMYTSHNLHEIGNGFIEKTYDYFYPAK